MAVYVQHLEPHFPEHRNSLINPQNAPGEIPLDPADGTLANKTHPLQINSATLPPPPCSHLPPHGYPTNLVTITTLWNLSEHEIGAVCTSHIAAGHAVPTDEGIYSSPCRKAPSHPEPPTRPIRLRPLHHRRRMLALLRSLCRHICPCYSCLGSRLEGAPPELEHHGDWTSRKSGTCRMDKAA